MSELDAYFPRPAGWQPGDGGGDVQMETAVRLARLMGLEYQDCGETTREALRRAARKVGRNARGDWPGVEETLTEIETGPQHNFLRQTLLMVQSPYGLPAKIATVYEKRKLAGRSRGEAESHPEYKR